MLAGMAGKYTPNT